MKQIIIVVAVLLALLAGCKKDESSPVAPGVPGAPGTVTEVEPNDQTPQLLGTLGTTDVTVNGSSTTDTDVDKYSIVLGGTTNLHVEISWTGASNLDVGIMNPSGYMLSFRGNGTNPELCTLTGLPAGTYTVYVSAGSLAAAPQSYVVKVGPR
jgi:hypothetical protein